MSTSTTHPLYPDITLTFDSINHTYIDNRNKQYTSITTYIADHFEKFDADLIATRCAIKRNVSKESLLLEWKEKGDKAAHQGTLVHDCLYNKFNNIAIDFSSNPIIRPYEKQINLIYETISKQLDIVFIEKIVFDPVQLLAGTCDSVFLTKNKDKYVVIDWKTSKTIDKHNNFKKFGYGIYKKLPDCNYVHYSIQLNLYSKLLKEQGYLELDIPIVKKIVHILPTQSTSIEAMKIK